MQRSNLVQRIVLILCFVVAAPVVAQDMDGAGHLGLGMTLFGAGGLGSGSSAAAGIGTAGPGVTAGFGISEFLHAGRDNVTVLRILP